MLISEMIKRLENSRKMQILMELIAGTIKLSEKILVYSQLLCTLGIIRLILRQITSRRS